MKEKKGLFGMTSFSSALFWGCFPKTNLSLNFSLSPPSFSLSLSLSLSLSPLSLQTSNTVVGAFGLSDPLTLGIAVHCEDLTASISYCTKFSTSDYKECESLWKDFSADGELSSKEENPSPSQPGETIGAAIAVKVVWDGRGRGRGRERKGERGRERERERESLPRAKTSFDIHPPESIPPKAPQPLPSKPQKRPKKPKPSKAASLPISMDTLHISLLSLLVRDDRSTFDVDHVIEFSGIAWPW